MASLFLNNLFNIVNNLNRLQNGIAPVFLGMEAGGPGWYIFKKWDDYHIPPKNCVPAITN